MDGSYWLPIGNPILRIQWSRDGWRHVTPKGQGRDPDIFEAQYLNNRASYIVGSYWLAIGNDTLRIHWSHDRWRHVIQKVKVVTVHNAFEA